MICLQNYIQDGTKTCYPKYISWFSTQYINGAQLKHTHFIIRIGVIILPHNNLNPTHFSIEIHVSSSDA